MLDKTADSEGGTRTFSWRSSAIGITAARKLSGLDFVRKIMDGEIPPPPIFELIGIQLVWVAPGEVSCAFTPCEFHYNPMGSVHGGVISTLLDSAMGLAVLTQLPIGSNFAAIELKINFVRPVTTKNGGLLALGKVVHSGGRIPTADGRLVDASGKLHAHGTTTCIVFRDEA